MSTRKISIAQDFSPSPAGRFATDGPYSGEVFRNEILHPAIKSVDNVIVDFSGTEMAGSSFLEETFGGLVRLGMSESTLKLKLKLQSPRNSDVTRAWKYINDADKQISKRS